MPMRPCRVEISTRALEENFRFLAGVASAHAELLAMVKCSAYGHSLALCVPALAHAGAKWFGVTTVEEAIAARALNPAAHILIMAGIFPAQGAAAIQFQLTPVVWEQWHLDELQTAARAAGAAPESIPVHLEIDTGMSRQGVLPDHLSAILARFGPTSPLRLEGVMTHLFAADEADGKWSSEQLKCLDQALSRISSAGQFAEWLSVGSSAALIADHAPMLTDLASRHGMKALLRPGLALYGVVPEFDPAFDPPEPASLIAARAALQPVLSWKASVVGVRSIPVGATIGYNATFVATEPMRVALISVGYGDGLDRTLSNSFSLLVRGQRVPLVGRISMDQSVLDVTEIPDVAVGDEVVILGSQQGETITAFDHAAATETIPWEVFTRIAARVPRIAV